MHIPDGIISGSACVAGFIAAGGLNIYSLIKLNNSTTKSRDLSRISMVTGVFFVASLVQIPFPPTSVHPILSGLCGILMGAYAPIAISLSLLLQFILFGYGGITTLGVNASILIIPALIAWQLYSRFVRNTRVSTWRLTLRSAFISMVCTSLSVGLYTLVITSFMPSYIDQSLEYYAMMLFALAHVPLIIIESIVGGFFATTKVLQRLQVTIEDSIDFSS